MSVEDVEILKERALKFLKNAEFLFENEVYDLAAFNAQQFVELYLKYKLFLMAGEYPKDKFAEEAFKGNRKDIRQGA